MLQPDYQPILGPMARTAAWHAAQNRYLGASLAAGVCGMSEYKDNSPRRIYLEKRGEIEHRPQTMAMRIGTAVEPVILGLYAEQKQCIVDTGQYLRRHPDYPFIGCTPDAVCKPWDRQDKDDWNDNWLAEAKSTSARQAQQKIGDPEAEEVPMDWLFQCQQQMLVMGPDKTFIDLAVLVGNEDFKIIPIQRNSELIDQIIEATTELWERIQSGNPPPIDYAHPGALKLVRDTYKLDPSGKVLLSRIQSALWKEHEELGEAVRYAEKRRDFIKARILDAMGNAATAVYDGPDISLTLKRSLVRRGAYQVKECEYITLRRVKG